MFKWAILYAFVFCSIGGFILFGYIHDNQAMASEYYEKILIAAALCMFTVLVHWFLYQLTLPPKKSVTKTVRPKTILEQLLSDQPTYMWTSWTPVVKTPQEQKEPPAGEDKNKTVH